MWNNQNYATGILRFVHVCTFHSYQSGGSTAEANSTVSFLFSICAHSTKAPWGPGACIPCMPLYSLWQLPELPSMMGPLSLCAHGASWVMSMNTAGNGDTHIIDISSAHTQAPLPHWMSLAEHKFKDKTILNFKTARPGPFECRACATAQVTCPWSWPWAWCCCLHRV